jgi:mannose-6-phosphate isomerase-like protein (cupin superfamily)
MSNATDEPSSSFTASPPAPADRPVLEPGDPGRVRRVVTGTDASGKAVVLSDGPAPVHIANDKGYRMVSIWATDRTPPDAGGEDLSQKPYQLEPPAGGAHFRIVVWPEDDRPGRVHSTETLDVLYILSGRVVLTVGEGTSAQDVSLSAGDSVVALGNVHAWRNPGPGPCVAVASMLSFLPVNG